MSGSLEISKFNVQLSMIRLRYGNTNTFFIRGRNAGLLVDTDYAGTLPCFFKSLKASGIELKEISYVLATHYHPDHIGLIGELQKLGIRLLIIDRQLPFIHFSDRIFEREKRISYAPPDENLAEIICCGESREFLEKLGIEGEIISTPSHSEDSISLILDDGICLAGDLEPFEYLAAYGSNPALEEDWKKIMSFAPKEVHYAHANEKKLK